LIERALSEDIAIQVETQSENWCCRTDPHQLETAILNLAINGRDAMPSGGRLTLATLRRTVSAAEAAGAEVAPGDYVVIRVGDTGAGMTPDVLERAFEPFFTTKSVGRGTGLGLSQVYGFAKQSGGFVSIHTAPERGTEVDIHLPRSDPAPVAAGRKPPAPPESRGDASILVVEDDAGVRAVACQMLRDLGYAVTEAPNGRRALEAIEERPFDLVFSDVILPDGLSGLDLAHEVQRRASATPVLLTSGYTGQRLSPIDESPFRILRKPYGEAQLSEAVRAALASKGRSSPNPSASDREG
jgi:CheY-like chemotaxis protein